MARFEERRGMEHERHRAHRGKGKHARHASDVVSQYHVERPSLDRPNRAPGLIDVCERLRKRSSSHAPVKFDAISTRYAWLPRRARRDDDDLVPAPSQPVRCRLHDSRRSTRAIRKPLLSEYENPHRDRQRLRVHGRARAVHGDAERRGSAFRAGPDGDR
jgi:hypothetical protein